MILWIECRVLYIPSVCYIVYVFRRQRRIRSKQCIYVAMDIIIFSVSPASARTLPGRTSAEHVHYE